MKSRLVQNRSSYLVVWPVIAVLFLSCIISFIFKSYFLSLVLLILFLVMLTSRLWAERSVKDLKFSVRNQTSGVFPGEALVFDLDIKNDKFLPVMCAQVYFPLAENLCLMPEDVRAAEEYEKSYLIEKQASTEKVGEKNLPTLLWYESRSVESRWSASRRGIYSTEGWKLFAGDGFGLSQLELAADSIECRKVAVYPALVPVDLRMFMRLAWSADTANRGIMEDNTVIRSTRDYRAGDPVKHINWRLYAKGLPMSVNIYEEILPQSMYFFFDGESFSGKEKHLAEMEDALSITASVIVSAEGKIRAGISFSKDKTGLCKNVETGAQAEDILWAFAGYSPRPDSRDEENKISDQLPEFDLSVPAQEDARTGRFYYVTYDAEKLKENRLLRLLGADKTTILSYQDTKPYPGFETVHLAGIKITGAEDKNLGNAGAAPSEGSGKEADHA